MLLDEPTEGVDDATALQILANLRQALPDTTIIAAIHSRNTSDITTHANQTIQLAHGKIIKDPVA
jgi:ATP-binding cassette subfamily C protein CydC